MDSLPLRLLIESKLADGRLPFKIFPRISGGASYGQMCDVCDEPITKEQFGLEETGIGQNALHFHVRCFNVWDELCRSARTKRV
jgi:hypothetical protein